MANTNASNQPIVMFDEFSKLRILDPAQFEASEKLKEECKDFTQRMNNFNDIVKMFLGMIEEKAQQIETEKLTTIGLRNRAEHEVENRKSVHAQMQTLIKERQAELDRLTVQAESLAKVQQEQMAFIDTLTAK